MNESRIYINRTVLAAGISIFAAGIACAQNTFLQQPDLQETLMRFYAASSVNAAFLSDMECRQASLLHIDTDYGNGHLINYYEPDSYWRMEAEARSFYRLNDKLMLTGEVSYGFSKGKNMTGSVFLNPERAPFDIVEQDPANAGRKRKEWYHLKGGLGYRLNKKLALGASLAYGIQNYAKLKDLRHQNEMLDLDFTVGATYRFADKLTLGASFLYHRNLQTVYFKIYGNTDRQYASLISFGGFYGRTELFGESGYTADKYPLLTQSVGGAFQVSFTGENLKWMNELSVSHLSGQFGSGSTTAVVYSRHHGTELNYLSKLIWEKEYQFHSLNLNLHHTALKNDENSFQKSTDEAGVSHIIYYGTNQVGDKKQTWITLSHHFLQGRSMTRSNWGTNVSAAYFNRSTEASIFPYYRKQQINSVEILASAHKNWYKGKNLYTLAISGSGSSGWGTPKEDGMYSSVSGEVTVPSELPGLLAKEYDYLTATVLAGGLKIGYEREVLPKLTTFVVANMHYRQALNTSLKGDKFITCGVSAGVKF